MNKKRKTRKSNKSLRTKIAGELKKRKSQLKKSLLLNDPKILVHELHVHQTELEIQNEQLHQTVKALEEAKLKYYELYNRAPVGYFVFNTKGKIIDVNLTGCVLLGDNRKNILEKPFQIFLAPKSRREFHKFCSSVLTSKRKQECELILDSNKRKNVYLLLTGTITNEKKNIKVAVTDITEHKLSENERDKAADELKELKNKLERFVHERTQKLETANRELILLAQAITGTNESVCITDSQKSILFVNKTFQKIYGYSSGEIVGKQIEILCANEIDVEKCGEIFKRAIEQNWKGEILYRKKNGTEFPAAVSISPLKDDDGVVTAFMVLCIDITERKLAEIKLKDNEQRYKALFQQSSEPIYLYDLNTMKIVEANHAFHSLLGYTPKECTSLTLYDLIAHDRESINRYHQHIIRNGIARIGERKWRCKNGTVKDVHVSAKLIHYMNQDLVLVISRDVTERKQAEKKIHLLANAIASTNEMISITDLENRFVFVNQAFLDTYGYSIEELIGQEPHFLRAPSCDENLGEQIFDAAKQGSWKGELLNRKKDGTIFPISLRTSPISSKDRIVLGFIGIAEDITERKHAEAEILRRLNAERLISNISSRFINIPTEKVDEEIISALGEIGKFAGVDRVYIFLPSDDEKFMSNTHEWCSDGIEPIAHILQNIPTDSMSWTVGKLRTDEIIILNSIGDLPTEAIVEREMFSSQNIKSLLGVPMFYQNRLIGGIGFDAIKGNQSWTDADIAILRLSAEIITNVLVRKGGEQMLRRSREIQDLVLSAVDTVLYYAHSEKICSTTWMSENVERLTGFPVKQFLTNPTLWRERIHPDDYKSVIGRFASIAKTRELTNRYRWKCANDNYRWFLDKAILMYDEKGNPTEIVGTWVDITVRVEMENKLRESETEKKAILQSVPVMLYKARIDDNFSGLWFGDSVRDITGFSSEDFTTNSSFWISRLHPDDSERVKLDFGKLLRGELTYVEYRWLCADGIYHWFTDRATLMRGKDSNPKEFVGVRIDITERKKIEEEIQWRSSQMRALHQLGLKLSAELNIEVLLSSIALHAVELVGGSSGGFNIYYAERDMLERHVSVGRHPIPVGSKFKRGEGLAGKVLETGKPLIVNDYRHWEGRADQYNNYPVGSVIGVPIRWGDEFLGILNVASELVNTFDQSDVEIMEMLASQASISIVNARLFQKVRESEEHYRNLVETSPDSITLTDLESNIIFANKRVAELHGYNTPEDMIGLNAFDLIAPEDRDRAAVNAIKVLKGEPIKSVEYTLLRKDGSRFFAELNATLIKDVNGKPISFLGVVRDITDRKRAESKYKDIFFYAPVGIYQSTLDGRILTANLRLAQILGYDTAEEISELNLENDIYFNKGEREALIAKYEPGGSIANLEVLWRKKGGAPVWISLNAHTVKDSMNRTQYFEGFVHDITERKEAERALLESERRFREMIEKIQMIGVLLDVEGRITFANKYLLDIVSYSSQEVLGQSWFDMFIPNDQIEKVKKSFYDRIFKGQIRPNDENDIITRSGERRNIIWNNTILRDSGGNIIGTASIGEDITAHKRAELALVEIEQNYRNIFDNALEGIYQSTPDGKFITVNPSLAKILGYDSPEELIQKIENIGEEIHCDPNRRVEFVKLLQKQSEVRSFEFEGLRKDGSKIWLLENARSVRDADGKIRYIEGAVQDITERKAADEMLRGFTRQIIGAQENERGKVARELHDSVIQLMSAAKHKLAAADEKISKETGSTWSELSYSGELIEKAIREIRNISQGLKPSILEDLGLIPAIRALCEEVKTRTGIGIHFKSSTSYHRYTHDIELVLYRIIQEALNNIEKHSRATDAEIVLLFRAATIRAVVKDNGIGFDPRNLIKKGTFASGYGHTNMKERASSVGGTVEIHSIVGQGTQVVVTIPYKE